MNNDALKKIKETQKAVAGKMVTFIVAGLGVVAALAWNEAITSLFNEFFKQRGSILAKFIYAIIVSVIVVIFSSKLSRFIAKAESDPAKEN